VPVADADLRVLLYQLLRELLFNVIKHAGTGRARLTAERDGEHVRVVVEDEGTGFDPAELEEPQADGLGLPSVRERLELVGGQLDVASAPGQGTRVSITVPTTAGDARNA
jgi:signal transduction histidine kinase